MPLGQWHKNRRERREYKGKKIDKWLKAVVVIAVVLEFVMPGSAAIASTSKEIIQEKKVVTIEKIDVEPEPVTVKPVTAVTNLKKDVVIEKEEADITDDDTAPDTDTTMLLFESSEMIDEILEDSGNTSIRGDVNGDGIINLGDVLYLVNYLYKGGPAPDPFWTGDFNEDGNVSVADVLSLINYLYGAGSSMGVIRGDANGNGDIDIADITYLTNYLYNGGPAPDPMARGDPTEDGVVDLLDVLWLINYLFKDPNPDGLEQYEESVI